MISPLNKLGQGVIMPKSQNDSSSLELVSKIVSAYVSKNSLPPGELLIDAKVLLDELK